MLRRVVHVLDRGSAAALACVLLGGCGDAGPAGPLPSPPPLVAELGPGRWYLNTANGAALPAMVAERFVGVAVEQTFLDSARLDVDVSQARWEQRYWYRVEHSGIHDRSEVVFDGGSYTIGTPISYFFASEHRVRTLVVSPQANQSLVTTEPVVFWTDAPTVAGVYQRTRP